MIIKEAPLADVWQLRQEVMYPNDTVAAVQLEDDPIGVHLGLYEHDQLVTVVSLFMSGHVLQFRKFATRVDTQHKGFGSAMLQYVMQWAQEKEFKLVWCNARLTAIKLYERFGMEPVGAEWEKNGIQFIKMQKEL